MFSSKVENTFCSSTVTSNIPPPFSFHSKSRSKATSSSLVPTTTQHQITSTRLLATIAGLATYTTIHSTTTTTTTPPQHKSTSSSTQTTKLRTTPVITSTKPKTKTTPNSKPKMKYTKSLLTIQQTSEANVLWVSSVTMVTSDEPSTVSTVSLSGKFNDVLTYSYCFT